MKKIGLLGCGHLGRIIASSLVSGLIPGAELTAIFVRDSSKNTLLSGMFHCPVVNSIESLLSYHPDIVMEAATPEALKEYGESIISRGADLIVLSTSAFGNTDFYGRMEKLAEKHDCHIHLSHGVIGGLDVAEAARMMGEVTASVTKRKFSKDSSFSDAVLNSLPDTYSGSAREAMNLFPSLLNVGISLGLSVNDLDTTKVEVATTNGVDFTVKCTGRFGYGQFYTQLGPEGPALAACSALVALKHMLTRISF